MTRTGAIAPAQQPVVFVVDDDASMRDALDDLLSSAGLQVQSFRSPQEFLRSERPDAPGCLVLDIKMPGQSGLDFQSELTKLHIELPIIFITGHGDISMSVRAMKAGAIEFLPKPFRDQDLLDAIQVGFNKDRVRCQEAAAVAGLKKRFETLTPREQEVMTLVAAGRLNKQIASDLKLSLITVKVHRGHVMRKMQAGSFWDLVRMAEKLGLVTENPTQTAIPGYNSFLVQIGRI